MTEFSRATLQAVVEAEPVIGLVDGAIEAVAYIPAADGEIQLSEDGQAWWLHWDRTHAVDAERELQPPDTQDPAELARWMVEQARQLDEEAS